MIGRPNGDDVMRLPLWLVIAWLVSLSYRGEEFLWLAMGVMLGVLIAAVEFLERRKAMAFFTVWGAGLRPEILLEGAGPPRHKDGSLLAPECQLVDSFHAANWDAAVDVYLGLLRDWTPGNAE